MDLHLPGDLYEQLLVVAATRQQTVNELIVELLAEQAASTELRHTDQEPDD